MSPDFEIYIVCNVKDIMDAKGSLIPQAKKFFTFLKGNGLKLILMGTGMAYEKFEEFLNSNFSKDFINSTLAKGLT